MYNCFFIFFVFGGGLMDDLKVLGIECVKFLWFLSIDFVELRGVGI